MALKAGYVGVKKNTIGKLATRSEMAVLGAKNLLPNSMINHTTNGVTFSVAADHVISLTGTTTGNIDSTTGGLIGNISNLPKGKYKLTGCPTGGSSSTYRLVIVSNTSPATYAIDTGEGADFEVTDSITWGNVYIRINTGVNMNNKVFKPMIRLASDPIDIYAPFAMTNQQLTNMKIDKLTATIDNSVDLNNVTESGLYAATSSPINAPESKNYFALLVAKRTDGDIKQMIFKDSYIYIRSRGGSPAAWGNWYKYTGTAVQASKSGDVTTEIEEEPETKTTRSTKKTATIKEGE